MSLGRCKKCGASLRVGNVRHKAILYCPKCEEKEQKEPNEKRIALRAATLNRYYTAMLQASIMGLVEFVGFNEEEIRDMVTDMFTQLDEAKKHYEGVLNNE